MTVGNLTHQLETCAKDLTNALQVISTSFESQSVDGVDAEYGGQRRPTISSEAPSRVHDARTSALNTMAHIETTIGDHSHFLQRLARHAQILGCLQWLCHFQVLACIPMNEAVSLADIAYLAHVPETELRRVVRMMTTVGFLHEPQEGCVAHNELSAPFVAQPAVHDAAVFISESAAPAALKMSAATEQFAGSQRPDESAYRLACNNAGTCNLSSSQQLKLRRQWPAYLRYGIGDNETAIKDLFTRMNWGSLGTAKVVDVGAQSTTVAIALASLFPDIRFVVQPSEDSPNDSRNATSETNKSLTNSWGVDSCLTDSPLPSLNGQLGGVPATLSSRISMQQRTHGSPQPINDASVYILRLPSPAPSTSFQSIAAKFTAELKAHLDVLRTNLGSKLVVTARVLPEPGSVDSETEATALMRDLSLQQLASGREAEITDIRNILLSLRDSFGGLVVTNEFRSQTSSVVALEARYQSFRPSLFDST